MELGQHLSVRHKHIIILLLVAVGFLITGGLSRYSSESLHQLHELANTLETLSEQVLELRKTEKDFLARKDAAYIEEFNRLYDTTKATSSEFERGLVVQLQDSALNLSDMKRELDSYQQSFNALAQYQQTIGLDHKSGLYGALRGSIHQVEAVIQNQPMLLSEMLMLRRHEKDFMLRRDSKYIDKFNQSIETFKTKVPVSLKAEIIPILSDYQTQFMKLYEAEKMKGLSHKDGLHGTLRAAAHNLETIFSSVKEELKVAIHDQTETVTAILYGTLALLAVITLFSVLLVSNSISVSLNKLIQYVLSLINDDELAHRVQSKTNELDILESAFNGLNQKLSHAISEIKTSANSITDVATEMSVMTEQVNLSTAEQHMKVEQSATAMEEMSCAIQEVARNAQGTANFVGTVNEKLNETTTISGMAQDAIRTLQEEVQNSVSAIGQLEDTSADIETLLDSIQDIADQTNMLALNAAIEAARAGDHGRGFAVVADEVRTLSARTHSATEEVRSTLSQFKEVIANVVASVSLSSEKGAKGQHQADQAIQMMREMTQKVAEISMMNIQIATSVEEQTAAANELNSYIHDIFESSKSLKEHSEQTSLATVRLGEVVNDINTSASAFAV